MAFNKHLLVDGANLLHAWPELRALLKRDRGAARSRLASQLSAIHDAEQTRVTLVFDGRGPKLAVEHPGEHETFTLISTPAGLTADDVIEQLVARAPDAGACHVATADQAVRQTITALGAHWVPPEDLAQWAAGAAQRVAAQVAGLRRNNAQQWRRPAS